LLIILLVLTRNFHLKVNVHKEIIKKLQDKFITEDFKVLPLSRVGVGNMGLVSRLTIGLGSLEVRFMVKVRVRVRVRAWARDSLGWIGLGLTFCVIQGTYSITGRLICQGYGSC